MDGEGDSADAGARILQPGFFMENFEGPLGPVAVGFFKKGLKQDTTIAVIVSGRESRNRGVGLTLV